MNVTVENLAPCKQLLRVDVDAQTVQTEFDAALKEYQREVQLPGFRKGKAPREVLLKLHEKEILEHAKEKLLRTSFDKATKEQKLKVVMSSNLEDIGFSRETGYQYVVTVETAPEYQLPEYRGLPAKRGQTVVQETQVDQAIDMLRKQAAKSEKVDRALEEGDFAVVNYSGSCEGKPLVELVPSEKRMGEQKNFWIPLEGERFLPGFKQALIGAKAGDKRTVEVEFPATYPTPVIAGKKATYEVEVVEAMARILPPLDEAFAKAQGAENLDELRNGVRKDLQHELDGRNRENIRTQVVDALLQRVNCDLPESLIVAESRNIVFNIVSDMQQKGANKEEIDAQKEEIGKTAAGAARERVKANFIFQEIATKEGISVSNQELYQNLQYLAMHSKTPIDRYIKELEKRDGIREVARQVLVEKVVQFLAEQAHIEDVPEAPVA